MIGKLLAHGAPLWVRLAVCGVIGAALMASIAATVVNARGFSTDQYERGRTAGRVEMAGYYAREALKVKTDADRENRQREESERAMRSVLLRRAADAEQKAAVALARLKQGSPDYARCDALPWPSDVRRHHPLVLRDPEPAASGDGGEGGREAAAAGSG